MPARPATPEVIGFYHQESGSIAYLVADTAAGRAAVIDPVLDYDEKAARISTESADAILTEIARRKLKIDWILDTHPHADHMSAAHYLKEKLGARTAIGEKVIEMQKRWREIYNIGDFPTDGAQWDTLFADGASFKIGDIEARVMLSPGHTAASISYLVGDAAFIHDTLLQPDFGTARADFPGAGAAVLYRTIMAILALPGETRLFCGHDYRPNGRQPRWESTVTAQKTGNVHLKQCPDSAAFVTMREARDRTLGLPKLMLQALQVNLRGGRLPPPEDDDRSYLKIPLNRF